MSFSINKPYSNKDYSNKPYGMSAAKTVLLRALFLTSSLLMLEACGRGPSHNSSNKQGVPFIKNGQPRGLYPQQASGPFLPLNPGQPTTDGQALPLEPRDRPEEGRSEDLIANEPPATEITSQTENNDPEDVTDESPTQQPVAVSDQGDVPTQTDISDDPVIVDEVQEPVRECKQSWVLFDDSLQNIMNLLMEQKLNSLIAAKKSSPQLVFSPFSIAMVLQMLERGASGPVLDKMQDKEVLSCFDQGRDSNSEFTDRNKNRLQQITRAIKSNYENSLVVGNSIWSLGDPQGEAFQDSYKKDLKDILGADALGFNQVKEINDWVARATKNKIPDLLKEGSGITSALVNATYFKGKWKTLFKDDSPRAFTGLQGELRSIPMMSVTSEFHTINAVNEVNKLEALSQFQIVRIPFDHAGLSMDILMVKDAHALNSPKGRQSVLKELMTFEKAYASHFGLELAPLSDQKTELKLILPPFKMETELDLLEDFKNLGYNLTGALNFEKMLKAPGKDHIDQFIHKAIIEVDKNGAEAAAATAIGMTKGFSLSPPIVLVNKPFFYIIHAKISEDSPSKLKSANKRHWSLQPRHSLVPVFVGFYGGAPN